MAVTVYKLRSHYAIYDTADVTKDGNYSIGVVLNPKGTHITGFVTSNSRDCMGYKSTTDRRLPASNEQLDIEASIYAEKIPSLRGALRPAAEHYDPYFAEFKGIPSSVIQYVEGLPQDPSKCEAVLKKAAAETAVAIMPGQRLPDKRQGPGQGR